MTSKINRGVSLASCITMLLSFVFLGCRKAPQHSNWTYQISKTKHAYLATLKTLTTLQAKDALALNQRVINFVQDPSPSKLGEAKLFWRSSWNTYNRWKPFFMMNANFANGLLLDIDRVETKKINETYLDYTSSQPNGGIIMDTIGFPTIDYFSFDSWNTNGAPKDRTIGYQVLEFLLFGEDMSAQSPGNRPSTDYSSGTPFAQRRRTFLQFSSSYFSEEFIDLEITQDLENGVLNMENTVFIKHVMSSLITFIETDFAQETIRIPYLSQDENDELSRFSDNTMTDILMKYNAIKTVLYGFETFGETNGYFFGNLIEEIKPSSGEVISVALAEIEKAISLLVSPFEVAIQNTSDRQQLDIIYKELTKISDQLKLFEAIF